jgi:N-acetylglucosaminyldiphosphoundecaprenol N-acetyl-beta-D-mannosaminyltransferase
MVTERGELMRTDVLGVGFDNLTMNEAIERAEAYLSGRTSAYVVTPNPEIVWLCKKDPAVAEAVSNAALVLPDGIGVIYGAKILKRPLRERVSGTDFAEKLMERMAKQGRSAYLLGAKPGVAEKAAQNLTAKYPGLVVAGTADGFFTDDAPVVEAINAADPDFLIVGLGAPKQQERWMAIQKDKLRVGLMGGFGGSIDVWAGTVARAPMGWQKANLEWLYRLIKQPKRIKRQIKLPLFMFAVIGQRLRGK